MTYITIKRVSVAHEWKFTRKFTEMWFVGDTRLCTKCGTMQTVTALIGAHWRTNKYPKWSPKAGRCKGPHKVRS